MHTLRSDCSDWLPAGRPLTNTVTDHAASTQPIPKTHLHWTDFTAYSDLKIPWMTQACAVG